MQVKHRSDLSKIAKNAGISGMGEVILNIIGYATSIVIARTIGSAAYGIFSLANIVTNMARIFASSGPGHGLLRFVAYYKGKNDFPRLKGAVLFGTKVSFVLSIFFATGIFLMSDFIADSLFHDLNVSIAIKTLIVSLPFITLGYIWIDCIQSFQEIKYHVYIGKILQPLARLTLTVILFLFGLRLGGVLAAMVISSIIVFFGALYFLIKIFPFHKRLPPAVYERKEIMKFSLPVSLTQFSWLLTWYIDSLFLGYFRTSTEVGVYTAVAKVVLLIELPLISFNTIFGPMISDFYSKHQMESVRDLFKVVTKWIFTLSFPIFLVFVLFAQSIMGVFGEDFKIGAMALIIYGIGELINVLTGSSGWIILMTGRPGLNLFNSSIFLVLSIVLNYLLIPEYGIVGAAIATGIAIAVINILKLSQVYMILRVHPYNLNYLKPCFAGLLAFLIIFLVNKILSPVSIFSVTILSVAFFALYAVFVVLCRLDEEDKYILKLIQKKLTGKNTGKAHS